jgi:hypothetical protein
MFPKTSSRPAPIINDGLKIFLESGVSVVVGTRDVGLAPEIVRAWGPVVSEDLQSISLCVAQAAGVRTLDNLSTIGQISVVFTLPTNLQSVQLKGRWIETTEPDAADLAAVEKHRDAFATLNETIGMPRRVVETFWKTELENSPVLVKLRFVAEQVFNQTPGPDAGSRL